jgi:hypothetical protein
MELALDFGGDSGSRLRDAVLGSAVASSRREASAVEERDWEDVAE